LRDMESSGVEKAIVFGFAFRDAGVSRFINDYVSLVCKRHPGKLLGLGCLCPESPGALEEAERCLDIGLSGFGELFPAGHGYSLSGSGMKRLAGLSREARVPLLVHVNERLGHLYPGKGDVGPEEAYAFAAENPEVTIVFAHLGGGLPFYYHMPEVRALVNAYYDTAAQPFLYEPRVYESLKISGALKRVLLGSDYPLLGWKRYLRDIQKSGLTADDIDEVTRGHALQVFGEFFLRQERGVQEKGQNRLI